MTVLEALAWADKTMNDRLREARRTGTDGDYDQAMENCIDALAAEARRLRALIGQVTQSAVLFGDGTSVEMRITAKLWGELEQVR